MHHVNDLLKELAGYIHTQQEPIDHLEDTMQNAHDTVESGYRRVSCASAMERPHDMLTCGGEVSNNSPVEYKRTSPDEDEQMNVFGCGAVDPMAVPVPKNDPQGYDRTIAIHDDDDNMEQHGCAHWKLQWETIKDGIKTIGDKVISLKEDLVLAGRDLRNMAGSSSTE